LHKFSFSGKKVEKLKNNIDELYNDIDNIVFDLYDLNQSERRIVLDSFGSINNNGGSRFKVAGGASGMKVSWQVTGIYVRTHGPILTSNQNFLPLLSLNIVLPILLSRQMAYTMSLSISSV
jgi:hypothetical protein